MDAIYVYVYISIYLHYICKWLGKDNWEQNILPTPKTFYKGIRERKQPFNWVRFKLDCDMHHRQSAKRLQTQKEVLPVYIANKVQLIMYMFSR